MEEKQSEAVADKEAGGESEAGGPLAKLTRFALPLVAALVLVLVAGGGFAFWSAKRHRAEAEQKLAAQKAEEAAKEAVEAAKARELATELHKQHQAVLEGATPAGVPAEAQTAEKPADTAGQMATKDKPAEEEKLEKADSAKKEPPAHLAAEVVPPAVPRAPQGAKKPPPSNLCTVRGGDAGTNLAQCLEAYNKLDRR